MIGPKALLELSKGRQTPFYVYDLSLLETTLTAAQKAAGVNPRFCIHYALKACYAMPVLKTVRDHCFGLDTVSGGEIELGVNAGFNPSKILYAGVGKTDAEIDLALQLGIECFNVESLPELLAINERALAKNVSAPVALRINPHIDAHTHHYITTGLSENKFGIDLSRLDEAVNTALSLPGVSFRGLHFHIGSQITVFEPFELLCERAGNMVNRLNSRGIHVSSINLGGGLGIDYDDPLRHPVPDFETYMNTVNKCLDTTNVDKVHFELGRSLVAQCGILLSRIVYVKEGDSRTFVIADAGMNNLLRPALYQARHRIRNISGEMRDAKLRKVDVVGPVCESADEFGKDYLLPDPRKGDLLAIMSVGAYGETMASRYNLRPLNPSIAIRHKNLT